MKKVRSIVYRSTGLCPLLIQSLHDPTYTRGMPKPGMLHANHVVGHADT